MANRRKSKSPVGKTMPFYKHRLETAPSPNDRELKMMELWAAENTRAREIMNYIPLDFILHQCNEKCVPLSKHYFTGELDDHGIKIAAATVQWLATNCGREYLERFFKSIGFEVILSPSKRSSP